MSIYHRIETEGVDEPISKRRIDADLCERPVQLKAPTLIIFRIGGEKRANVRMAADVMRPHIVVVTSQLLVFLL